MRRDIAANGTAAREAALRIIIRLLRIAGAVNIIILLNLLAKAVIGVIIDQTTRMVGLCQTALLIKAMQRDPINLIRHLPGIALNVISRGDLTAICGDGLSN